jgi:hypothetical protein
VELTRYVLESGVDSDEGEDGCQWLMVQGGPGLCSFLHVQSQTSSLLSLSLFFLISKMGRTSSTGFDVGLRGESVRCGFLSGMHVRHVTGGD